MLNANLSEELFKPAFKYPETSSLIQRCSENDDVVHCSWYRVINKPLWVWRGINALDLESVLSRIAMSNSPRTQESHLDTVVGYRKGNWIYEWSGEAMNWQLKAQTCQNDAIQQCYRYWLNAAYCYSLAAYPHIKGDLLAQQAEVLAHRAYQEVAKYASYRLKNIAFKVDGGSLMTSLYLPSQDDNEKGPYPTVLLCAGGDDLQNDHVRLFEDYLAPAGIAMLCIDLPSVGHSCRWKLTQDSSYLHQQVLNQLVDVPWVDNHKVVALGFQLGGNIATRLAYVASNHLRGVAIWNGIVHQLFVDTTIQRQQPKMYRDVFMNRLGLNQSSETLLQAEMASYSLKLQGLLGRRCTLPLLAIHHSGQSLSPLSDAQLIASSSRQGKVIKLAQSPLKENYQRGVNELLNWLNSQFS